MVPPPADLLGNHLEHCAPTIRAAGEGRAEKAISLTENLAGPRSISAIAMLRQVT